MKSTTEQDIIHVTIEMIKRDGYKDLSLRKVASETGLTTGAIYTHFKNKEELFYKTSLQIHQSISNKFDLNINESAYERLESVVQTLCQLFEEEPNEMEFIYFNPTLVKAYQNHSADFPFIKLTRSISDQANPGSLNDQQFFYQIWSFIQGYGLLIKNGSVHFDAHMTSVTIQQLCQQTDLSNQQLGSNA